MVDSFGIAQLASELGVTPRSIRFYEEQGMLAPLRRGQERIYSVQDRVMLELILRGKRIGFSLAECKELINLYAPQKGNPEQLQGFLEQIQDRRYQLEQQVLDIQQMQRELNMAEARCHAVLTTGSKRKKTSESTE